jgi:hypothetical protein
MFPKYNTHIGTFGLRMKLYTIWEAGSKRRLNQRQSCAQGSFDSVPEKGTNLRRKRLSSPQQAVLKSIVNMKGMNVISHRLRPVISQKIGPKVDLRCVDVGKGCGPLDAKAEVIWGVGSFLPQNPRWPPLFPPPPLSWPPPSPLFPLVGRPLSSHGSRPPFLPPP